MPEARLRGYSPSRFSFNSEQGRCPDCEGAGTIKLEMNFLPPAFVRCETCGGCRFNRETLDIEYRGKNIAQVLELSVDEAIEFFVRVPANHAVRSEALRDTGSRLYEARPDQPHAERRRSATLETGDASAHPGLKTGLDIAEPRAETESVHPGRADDRLAYLRCAAAGRSDPATD